jgi:hypothetical protein
MALIPSLLQKSPNALYKPALAFESSFRPCQPFSISWPGTMSEKERKKKRSAFL